jgi:hypothetical protein
MRTTREILVDSHCCRVLCFRQRGPHANALRQKLSAGTGCQTLVAVARPLPLPTAAPALPARSHSTETLWRRLAPARRRSSPAFSLPGERTELDDPSRWVSRSTGTSDRSGNELQGLRLRLGPRRQTPLRRKSSSWNQAGWHWRSPRSQNRDLCPTDEGLSLGTPDLIT